MGKDQPRTEAATVKSNVVSISSVGVISVSPQALLSSSVSGLCFLTDGLKALSLGGIGDSKLRTDDFPGFYAAGVW